MSPRVFMLLSALALVTVGAGAEIVTISNTKPRVDANGELMDMHDGNIMQWSQGGLFYWYGMSYTNCTLEHSVIPPQDCPSIYRSYKGFPAGAGCGFREDHDVSIYSSPNLVDWTYVGSALPVDGPRPRGVYFRPKVVFNPATSEYVLWVNFLPPDGRPIEAYPKTTYLVARSPNATGPFEVVNPKADLAASGPGDAALLVTESGEGYIAFDAWGNSHRVLVQQLTPDFYNASAKHTAELSPKDNEAPLLWERKGTYYLAWGHTCCFCSQGGGAQVWTAPHPLGPWTPNSDLNPGSATIFSGHFTIPAQSNYVFKLQETTGVSYIYTGDLWTSAHDKLKSHDLQYWQRIEWNDTAVPPKVEPMKWTDNFTLSLA